MSDPAHTETLRLLAQLYDAGGRGSSEVEAHLRAHGWAYISDHWQGPEAIATYPLCKYCGEPFEPFDPWATGRDSVANSCHARDWPAGDIRMHEPRL